MFTHSLFKLKSYDRRSHATHQWSGFIKPNVFGLGKNKDWITLLGIKNKLQIANSLYRKYGEHAIIEAFNSTQSLKVLKLLMEVKSCPITFTQTAFLADDYDEISVFYLAAKHGRLDFLKWIVTCCVLHPDHLNDTLQAAILNKQYQIIEWLIEKKFFNCAIYSIFNFSYLRFCATRTSPHFIFFSLSVTDLFTLAKGIDINGCSSCDWLICRVGFCA